MTEPGESKVFPTGRIFGYELIHITIPSRATAGVKVLKDQY
jgi:hypothetical protein